ncbi:hypothetical protein BD289DRAFT_104108 [Coniella lustricola]|uniref:Uncharacterized protein n=1 Tax=Coniella lustricola TaxID=2025994 RepID=A0A2T2ZXZ1_9PEZI|nr:hypothetical protein BD289DRAFT_104108 [Coniella lustricola]
MSNGVSKIRGKEQNPHLTDAKTRQEKNKTKQTPKQSKSKATVFVPSSEDKRLTSQNDGFKKPGVKTDNNNNKKPVVCAEPSRCATTSVFLQGWAVSSKTLWQIARKATNPATEPHLYWSGCRCRALARQHDQCRRQSLRERVLLQGERQL